MKSLFNTEDNQEMVKRFNSLTPSSQALWGKMNVAQMCSHCNNALKIAFGELKLKPNLIGLFFGSIAKKMVIDGDREMKKNLPTDKSLIMVDKGEFEKEKQAVISIIKRFSDKGPRGLANEKHPFFGKLNTEQWDKLSWKHLDHHLRQFGA
jgi:hypothetical protein